MEASCWPDMSWLIPLFAVMAREGKMQRDGRGGGEAAGKVGGQGKGKGKVCRGAEW